MVTKVLTRKRYLQYLNEDMRFCDLAKTTESQYHFVVTRYLDFTKNNPIFSRREIMSFVSSLGSVTSTYSAWVLSIVKRFHRTIQDVLPENKKKWPLGPKEGPKVKIRPQPSFDEKMVKRLFNIIDDTRDYAIVRLFFVTGMRRDELCRLEIISYNRPDITIIMAKGEETRTVKLDRDTCDVLDSYLKTRADNYPTLFVNDHSKPYTPNALSQVFKKYFSEMNVEGRTGLHAFRRGLVRVLHDKKMSREEIQKFFGWKSSTMVDRYLQMSPSEIGERVEKIHPFYKDE